MEIVSDMVVAMDYTLKNDQGEVLDTNQGKPPLLYLHGHGNIVEGLEEALAGKKVGDKLQVTVPPEKGYGVRNEQGVLPVPRGQFPDDVELEIDMRFMMQAKDGHLPVRIVALTDETVTVDANHELADQTLHFDVEVKEIRASTDEERKHGHAHGPEGHHH